MQIKSSIVYSQPNCVACVAAKHLLASKGYSIEERLIDGKTWTLQDVQKEFGHVRSVPQVSINGRIIGGLDMLRKYLERG
jgi:glutaredoxin